MYEEREELCMKKKIVALMLATMLATSITACGGNSNSTDSVKTEDTSKTEDASKTEDTNKTEDVPTESEEDMTYQSILDEYTQKIHDAVPVLVEEYNSEAAEKAGDINALAELSNSKIEELAKICNDGVSEMAKLKLKNSDSDDVYNEWAGKLQDVYMADSQQITDAYMESATN